MYGVLCSIKIKVTYRTKAVERVLATYASFVAEVGFEPETGPALAAVPVPEQRGLPGGRRPGRKGPSAHGELLHEQRDVFLWSAHRAPPPPWRAAPGWREVCVPT